MRCEGLTAYCVGHTAAAVGELFHPVTLVQVFGGCIDLAPDILIPHIHLSGQGAWPMFLKTTGTQFVTANF